MMEQNLSQNSTLSQLSSQKSLAGKRKREEAESESESVGSWCPLSFDLKLFTMSSLIDHDELFRQLGLARFAKGRYKKYKSWAEEKLWEQIVQALGNNGALINEHTMADIIETVKHYKQGYVVDPTLSGVHSDYLKERVELVLAPMGQDRGAPFVPSWHGQTSSPKSNESSDFGSEDLIIWQNDMTGLNNLTQKGYDKLMHKATGSTSEVSQKRKKRVTQQQTRIQVMEQQTQLMQQQTQLMQQQTQTQTQVLWDSREEHLARQYVDDCKSLNLSDKEIGRLVTQFPPSSEQYHIATMMGPQSRLGVVSAIWDVAKNIPPPRD